jgi:hypothetical protein
MGDSSTFDISLSSFTDPTIQQIIRGLHEDF